MNTDWKEEFDARFVLGEYPEHVAVAIHASMKTFIETLLTTQRAELARHPAVIDLREHQGQADEEGICVIVSRQALDEVLALLQEPTKGGI